MRRWWLWIGAALWARTASAEEPLQIRCAPSCVIDRLPEAGQRVRVQVLVDGRARAVGLTTRSGHTVHCAAGACTVVWTQLEQLTVTIDGEAAKVALATPSPSTRYRRPALDITSLAVSSERVKLGDDRIEIVGEDRPVPRKPLALQPEPPLPDPRASPPDGPSVRVIPGVPAPGLPGLQAPSIPTTTLTEADALDVFLNDVVLATSASVGCSGVAVGPRHVLTARHCLAADTIGVEREERRVESFRVVGRAVPDDPRVDVALLRVDRELRVAVRPRATALAAGPATGVARLVGFGTNDRAGRAGFGYKREGRTALSDWACDARAAAQTGCTPDLEITFSQPQVDTCRGDSGGPVLDWVNGRWRLVAIASRSIPGGASVCGRGGIYTHVGGIAAWIDRQLTDRPERQATQERP